MSVGTLLTYPLALPCARVIPRQCLVQAFRLCCHRQAPKEPFGGMAQQPVTFGECRIGLQSTLAGGALDAECCGGIFTGGNALKHCPRVAREFPGRVLPHAVLRR